MDKPIFKIEGVGEYGIDTEASPGNGRYYVKTYDGWHDVVGYSSKREAREMLDILHTVYKRKALGLKINEPMPE